MNETTGLNIGVTQRTVLAAGLAALTTSRLGWAGEAPTARTRQGVDGVGATIKKL